MLERALILMRMLNRVRMYEVYLNWLRKYGMADYLHMMESYFQTPSRHVLVAAAAAAAAAAIQML
jgi:hypothetical protein